jgi:hypothetical protein
LAALLRSLVVAGRVLRGPFFGGPFFFAESAVTNENVRDFVFVRDLPHTIYVP